MDNCKESHAAMLILLATMVLIGPASAGKSWSHTHEHSNHIEPRSHLKDLEVVCSKGHMTVNMQFDHPFYGVVFSHPSGPRHERCVHVGPRAGVKEVSFHIKYDSCGTVEDLKGQFHENTIVIQFGEDILEAWDEAKRLRCEWLESFEKPSSKPTLAISDLDVVELNFQGDDIDCWMEVQEGKGPWARKVGGLVPIGSPLTLVIAINDHSREFDMRIKRCSASDGKGSEIELTDNNGCVVRPKLLTPFAKVRDFGGKASLVAFSHISAFKFPDKMDVLVHCIVEVCRHGCPESCTLNKLDHHHLSKEFHYTLESVKRQKFAAAPPEVVPKKPNKEYPEPGRERKKVTLIQSSHDQAQQIYGRNATLNTTLFGNKKKILYNPATFKPLSKNSASEEVKTSASNVHLSYHQEIIKSNQQLHKSDSHEADFAAHQPLSGVHVQGSHHRIIGHDAHWVDDTVKKVEAAVPKKHFPSLKDISYLAPQPEPAAWSADEVKPLSKEEVFYHHTTNPDSLNYNRHLDVRKTYIPLTIGNDKHTVLPPESQAPQPEPAAWSADEVKPLSKEEVFYHQATKPGAPPVVHETHIPLSVGQDKHNDFPPHAPQQEPNRWKLEEINPMHSPEALRLQLESLFTPEPQPEPASWSLDNVKPLTKEDLRLISLNHKLRSQGHGIRTYKESLHPYSTSTAPEPIYIPQYTLSVLNMSNPNMMKMMSMMPTLLPYTYQTAHWPQKVGAKSIRPQRHHYPYPIPQFSPHQKMMMSVIADRRMDEDDPSQTHDLGSEEAEAKIDGTGYDADGLATKSFEAFSTDNANEETTVSAFDSSPGKILIGQTYKYAKTSPEVSISSESEMFTPVYIPISMLTADSDSSTESSETKMAELRDASGGRRLPISSFIPPSLDDSVGMKPDDKERIAHTPRALNRRKRSSESVFGVQQRFQAIAPSDLAFEWNLTSESASTFRGRREEIIYGICMSPAGMTASVGFILILTLLSIIVSVILYEQSCRLSNKKSQLSFITRNFNGQLEALYRITSNRGNAK